MGGSRSIGRCSNFARAQIHPLVMSTALFGFVTFLYERSFPMRLLIVRHADPDYSIDSLTPAGADSGGGLLCIAAGACEGHGVPDLKKSLPHGRNLQLAA